MADEILTEDIDSLLDFDEETAIVPVKTKSEIEQEQTDKIVQYRRVKETILSPEVARCIRDGWSDREIADIIGCSPQTVAKYRKSSEMSLIIDREARRLLNHLAKRDLNEEKYRDLVVSAGVLIDKSRQIRYEPEDNSRNNDSPAAILERVERILWGPPGIRESDSVIDITPEPDQGAVFGIHGDNEPSGSEADGRSPDGGSEHPCEPEP